MFKTVFKTVFRQKTDFTTIVFTIFSLTLASCSSSVETTPPGPTFRQRQLEEAIFFLEANIEGLGDAGYVQRTPETAALELVATMNAAQASVPGEPGEPLYPGERRRRLKPIAYVMNQPTEIWQVVLVPDDKAQMIYVKGYGKDLEQPLVEKSIPCCGY